MTLPTYANEEPRARAWATTRELIHADGSPHLATPQGQHRKTCEEIGEAALELRKLPKTKALAERLFAIGTPDLIYDSVAVLARRRDRLALELGDILVTLCIQAAMHGATLEECRTLAPVCGEPHTWHFVGYWADELKLSLVHSSQIELLRKEALGEIGALCRCVEDEARIQLSLTGPEVLALALDKIEGRTGRMVGGVFVKD
jgi:hypothetical protein